MAFTQEFNETIEVNGFGFVHGSTPDVKGNAHCRILKSGGTVRLGKAQDSACRFIRIILRFFFGPGRRSPFDPIPRGFTLAMLHEPRGPVFLQMDEYARPIVV